MNRPRSYIIIAGSLVLFLSAFAATAEIHVVREHNDSDHADGSFKFKTVPQPSSNDSGTSAKFSIVDGRADGNGGGVESLNDGRVPTEEDAPDDNFFFAAGTDGGRIVADMGRVVELKQVNSYSWHPGSRAPQVYELYASDGKADGFDSKPGKQKEPASCGWKLIAKVDARSKEHEGGQYGVSIYDDARNIGQYRYLLLAISQTEKDDDFGNTFYSEIDIVAADDPAPVPVNDAAGQKTSFTTNSSDGKCEIVITTTGEADMQSWATNKLAPALAEWYPKIAAMLPSEGYTPPDKFMVAIKPGHGVAATGGTHINANSTWLKHEITRQAVGSIIHEEVHVIQQYGRGRRNNPDAEHNPGWLVEGIADYIRFFKFEPETHGADIGRGVANARYDGSYRVTANFLDWVSEKYSADIVRTINAAMRDGKYREDIWKEKTGKSLQDLGGEWKAGLEKKFPAEKKDSADTNDAKTN